MAKDYERLREILDKAGNASVNAGKDHQQVPQSLFTLKVRLITINEKGE